MSWFNFQFQDFAIAFLSVLFEGVPFLLLGSLISGVVDVFVSPERITRMLPRKPGAAIFLGGLLGMVFPMCECGSVVIVRRFLKKGLPLSCATAYMLGAPIVSPVVALSTWQAFSRSTEPGPLTMVVLRLGIGYLLAVVVGFIVQNLPHRSVLQPGLIENAGAVSRSREPLKVSAMAAGPGNDPEGLEALDAVTAVMDEPSFGRKCLNALRSATSDFLDVAFFFVVGAAITCVFNTGIRQDILVGVAGSPLLSIVALMVLASVLALCSSTDAFVAWTFTAFSPAAKLAFLIFGPLFDLKLFWLYSLVFQRRFVAWMALGLFVVIALLCWRLEALNVLVGPATLPP